MFKRMSLLFTVLALLSGTQFFTSCDLAGTESDPSLEGYWVSSYGDGFEISGSTYTQYDDLERSVSFAGTIVNSPDLEAGNGYITILFTDAGSWMKPIGKYTVVYYENFTEDTVQQSTAYLVGGSYNDGMDTPAAAEAEYTLSKGYFYPADYVRK